MKYTVKIIWDNESNSWYCKSKDIPGLILCDASADVLMYRVRQAAPEFVEHNCNYKGDFEISFVTVR